MEFFFSVAALSGLLLAFKSTRVIGAVGLALLAITYPVLTLGTLIVAAGAAYFWRRSL